MDTINVGTTANDGTGDNLRAAMEKINSNFEEIHRENLIIDGQFNHWDEGAGPFTSIGYTSTMWEYITVGMSSPQVDRITHLSSSDSMYYAQISGTVSDTATGLDILRQRQPLENFQKYLGELITINIRVKGSVSGDIGIGISGDGITQQAELISIGTSFSEHSISFTLNNKAQVLSSDKFEINIDRYLGTNTSAGYTTNPIYEGDLDIDSVSIVGGSVAYDQAFPTPAEERQRIDEFYQIIGDYDEGVAGADLLQMYPTQAGTPATARQATIPLRRKMRAAPTVTLGTPSAGTLDSSTATTTAVIVTGTASGTSADQKFDYIELDARL